MILCYEGTPGSGKSLDAVVKIIDNLRLGRVVYTNISGIDDEVCREHIKIKTGMDDYEIKTHLFYLPDNQIIHPANYGRGGLIVIDEVHKLINARNWNKGDINQVWADWASTHRQGGYDVVLITQNLEKVDGQVRGLVEFTHRYKKNNYFGSLFESKYLVRVYEEDSKKVIGKRFGTYDPTFYKCYKSYAAGDIKEQKIQANVNILKHPIFYALPFLLVLTGFMFFKSSFASGDLFGANARLTKGAPVKHTGGVVQPIVERRIDIKRSEPHIINKSVSIKSNVLNPYEKVKVDQKLFPEIEAANRALYGTKANNEPVLLTNIVDMVYKGFVGFGDDIIVIVGNESKTLFDWQRLHPGFTVQGDILIVSGRAYSIGDKVVF